MTQPEVKNWSASKLLTIITLLSLALGAITGLSLGYAAQYEGPQTRVIYLFNNSLDFNETIFGISHDVFTPDRITVNRGDTLVIRYANIEKEPESHTFTMGIPIAPGPYKINEVVPAGHNVTVTFTANIPGVFAYVCTFHQPTMTGYLTVLG